MVRVLAGVAAVLACAFPACALAGDWRPAQKLTGAGSEPQVGVLTGGEQTVIWGPRAPTAGEAGGAGVQAVFRPPGDPFGAPVRVSPSAGVAPRLVTGPGGREV